MTSHLAKCIWAPNLSCSTCLMMSLSPMETPPVVTSRSLPPSACSSPRARSSPSSRAMPQSTRGTPSSLSRADSVLLLLSRMAPGRRGRSPSDSEGACSSLPVERRPTVGSLCTL